MWSDIRKRQLDRAFLDWFDWFRLSCRSAAKFQAGNGAESLVDAGRGQFLADGPFEGSLEPSNAFVRLSTAESLFDEVLTNSLEFEWSEFIGLRVAIELVQGADSIHHIAEFIGGLAFDGIIRFCKLQVGNQKLRNQQPLRARDIRSGGDTGWQCNFRQNSGILLTAFRRTVLPKVDVPTLDNGSSLTGCLVKAILCD